MVAVFFCYKCLKCSNSHSLKLISSSNFIENEHKMHCHRQLICLCSAVCCSLVHESSNLITLKIEFVRKTHLWNALKQLDSCPYFSRGNKNQFHVMRLIIQTLDVVFFCFQMYCCYSRFAGIFPNLIHSNACVLVINGYCNHTFCCKWHWIICVHAYLPGVRACVCTITSSQINIDANVWQTNPLFARRLFIIHSQKRWNSASVERRRKNCWLTVFD